MDSSLTNLKIKEILMTNPVNSHYRYETLSQFIASFSVEKPYENVAFLNYLWLKNFFDIVNEEENLDPKKSNNSGESESNDNSQRSKITLSQKTDYIIERTGERKK